MTKERLPKYISLDRNLKKYQVAIPIIGEDRNYYLGKYSTLEEAVVARDTYLKNPKHAHNLPKRKSPSKGIMLGTSKKKPWIAQLQFTHGKYNDRHVTAHLGSYETVEEAVQARLDFIENLK